jgi:hypothetical protein
VNAVFDEDFLTGMLTAGYGSPLAKNANFKEIKATLKIPTFLPSQVCPYTAEGE